MKIKDQNQYPENQQWMAAGVVFSVFGAVRPSRRRRTRPRRFDTILSFALLPRDGYLPALVETAAHA